MKIFNFENHLKFITEKKKTNIVIYKDIYERLYNTKKLIDNYKDKWDKYKKFINDYEYIYTSSNIHKNICKISPISRSYFKLHELLIDFNILKKYKDLNITCIAEGPGGFIQSLLDNIKKLNININNIYGISLISENKEIPSWNPKIKNNKNVKLLYGKDNTGDICNKDNILDFISKIKYNTCNLITCDGGIDYSNNYNNQELISYEFIYSEILLSLSLQKEGGTLIIKMFDLLYHSSIQLLYLLYQCYDNVSIYKPYTSRITNSEKYIICIGFKNNKNIIDLLKTYYEKKKEMNIIIPKSFINHLKYYNQIYVDNQIKNINNIIDRINNNKIYLNKPTKYQIEKAIEWCKLYDLDINNKCAYL